MKSNKCIYCNNDVKGKRRHFCSDVCNAKYWNGVYSKKWKSGDLLSKEKPTEEELEKSKKRYKAHQLAYETYKLGSIIPCDLCGKKTKHIHRHHENYDSPACILLCPKCHGLIRRYNNIIKKYFIEMKGGKK